MSCKDNKHLRKQQEGFLKKTQKNTIQRRHRGDVSTIIFNFKFLTFNCQLNQRNLWLSPDSGFHQGFS